MPAVTPPSSVPFRNADSGVLHGDDFYQVPDALEVDGVSCIERQVAREGRSCDQVIDGARPTGLLVVLHGGVDPSVRMSRGEIERDGIEAGLCPREAFEPFGRFHRVGRC